MVIVDRTDIADRLEQVTIEGEPILIPLISQRKAQDNIFLEVLYLLCLVPYAIYASCSSRSTTGKDHWKV